ncbi:MAG: hypothetical protein KIS96_15505 [Bauldia sp.]|nr:hypothetical protein [Bauldia sp.]
MSIVGQEYTRLVIDADDAREGVTGHGVRYVLGFGLAGVVVAFIMVLLFAG